MSDPEATDVDLRGVTKEFLGKRAVDGVSLQIRRGEFFSLLGPSGCGKTTLMRMISGFETPTSGTILLGGTDVARVPVHKRDVNMIFQNYALFPHLNVYENIAFGLKMAKTEKIDEKVHAALDMVRLPGYEKRQTTSLSGGEQQRVAIARAIVTHPRLLLLDEPLGALDFKLRKGMQEELKRIQHEVGITFLYVTHDQEEALSMSDRIAVMNHGRVEQIGSPEEIYERPATRFAAEFIGTGNFFEGTIADGAMKTIDGLHLPVPPGTPAGHATLMIRPEKMSLSYGGFVKAVVEEVLYQGALSSVLLKAGERPLVVTTAAPPRKGDTLSLSWRPEDARVLTT